jgi:hypothetical protein
MQNQTQESMFTEMSDEQAATYNGGGILSNLKNKFVSWLTGPHPILGWLFRP